MRRKYLLNYTDIIDNITRIAEKYDIDIFTRSSLTKAELKYSRALPFVGGFNTGKSSVINSVVTGNLLPVGIIPEECPPVEISYGTNALLLHRRDTVQQVDLCALRDRSVSLVGVSPIELKSDSAFLQNIENLMLVDLPGYDSGASLHDRWLRDYLLKCPTYILVISADEPVLKHSVAELLLGYTSPNKPVFCVLTKCDKIPKSELLRCVAHIEDTIKTFLPTQEVYIAKTGLKPKLEIEEFQDLLLRINDYLTTLQGKNQKRHYLFLCQYLKTVIENDLLATLLPLSERQRLSEKYSLRHTRFLQVQDSLLENFDSKIRDGISLVRSNIRALTGELHEPIQSMILTGQDIKVFLSGIIPAYINREVYKELNPVFISFEQSFNSQLELSGLCDRYLEFDEDALPTRVLKEALEKEEVFLKTISDFASRVSRKIKKSDVEKIIAELLLPEIERHIIESTSKVIDAFSLEFKSDANSLSTKASETKERILSGFNEERASCDDEKAAELKADLAILESYINDAIDDVTLEGAE